MKILKHYSYHGSNQLQGGLIDFALSILKNPFTFGVENADGFQDRCQEWLAENRPKYPRTYTPILFLSGVNGKNETLRICVGGWESTLPVLLSLEFVIEN